MIQLSIFIIHSEKFLFYLLWFMICIICIISYTVKHNLLIHQGSLFYISATSLNNEIHHAITPAMVNKSRIWKWRLTSPNMIVLSQLRDDILLMLITFENRSYSLSINRKQRWGDLTILLLDIHKLCFVIVDLQSSSNDILFHKKQ